MGQRVYDKADFYVRHGNRKRLRRLLNKRPQLRYSDDSFLLRTAIWHHPTLVPWLLDRGVSPDCRLGAGSNAPLMQAASAGDAQLVTLLLDYGANLESVNECNERALGFACAWRQPDTARILLQHGANPNTPEDQYGTYFDWAIRSQHTELVDLLRSFGGVELRSLPCFQQATTDLRQ